MNKKNSNTERTGRELPVLGQDTELCRYLCEQKNFFDLELYNKENGLTRKEKAATKKTIDAWVEADKIKEIECGIYLITLDFYNQLAAWYSSDDDEFVSKNGSD